MNVSVQELHDAMHRGELTSRQLVECCLGRIEKFDAYGPKLRAVLAVNPRAIQEADELDRAFRRSGPVGLLHGIPILVKDNIDTVDMPTTAGSVCLANHWPKRDAFLIRRLKSAGAIILAKTNLHEFAVWGETVSSLGGQTRNPYDLTRTPGGSSGGTGAGIAAGYGIAGIGTDTVNSVRSPASANGLVGIRPTTGMVSRSGLIPYSSVQDTAGPMARSVADMARVLEAIAGYDRQDPLTAWGEGQYSPGSFLAAAASPIINGLRFGILRSLFGRGPEHAQVNSVMEDCIQRLREQGAEFVELDEALDPVHLAREVSVHLFDLQPDLDAYLSKTGPEQPVHSLREVLDSGRYYPGIADSLKQARTAERNSPEYWQRLQRQSKLRDRLVALQVENKLAAFVFPHQQRLVVPIGETQAERNGVLASVTGFPAITVPAGFSAPTATAPIGVPIGIEFLARPWSEASLISIAAAVEATGTLFREPQWMISG